MSLALDSGDLTFTILSLSFSFSSSLSSSSLHRVLSSPLLPLLCFILLLFAETASRTLFSSLSLPLKSVIYIQILTWGNKCRFTFHLHSPLIFLSRDFPTNDPTVTLFHSIWPYSGCDFHQFTLFSLLRTVICFQLKLVPSFPLTINDSSFIYIYISTRVDCCGFSICNLIPAKPSETCKNEDRVKSLKSMTVANGNEIHFHFYSLASITSRIYSGLHFTLYLRSIFSTPRHKSLLFFPPDLSTNPLNRSTFTLVLPLLISRLAREQKHDQSDHLSTSVGLLLSWQPIEARNIVHYHRTEQLTCSLSFFSSR